MGTQRTGRESVPLAAKRGIYDVVQPGGELWCVTVFPVDHRGAVHHCHLLLHVIASVQYVLSWRVSFRHCISLHLYSFRYAMTCLSPSSVTMLAQGGSH